MVLTALFHAVPTTVGAAPLFAPAAAAPIFVSSARFHVGILGQRRLGVYRALSAIQKVIAGVMGRLFYYAVVSRTRLVSLQCPSFFNILWRRKKKKKKEED